MILPFQGSGSWFIQILCREIDKSRVNEDLTSILTRVARHVAIEKQSKTADKSLDQKKQIPVRQDTLTRYYSESAWIPQNVLIHYF